MAYTRASQNSTVTTFREYFQHGIPGSNTAAVGFRGLRSRTATPNELPRATPTKGNSAELTFQWTGVEYIAQKTSGLGNVDVYVDGHWRSSANLDLSDFPVFFNVVMFSVTGLARGDHSISVVNTGNSRINLEGFRVFQ